MSKDIDGGNWNGIRFTPRYHPNWHKADDNLMGTAVYGIQHCTATEWGAKFDDIEMNEFLFMEGSGNKWMIMTKA
jgi:hypothetical protein